MKSGLFALCKAAMLVWVFGASPAMAGVVITGTRVIYPAADKEVSVKVNNKGSAPALLQAWVDNGNADASPETIRVPFVINPPMNRVDAGKGQTLRLSYTGSTSLPSDKESVFWLNVLEVPPVDATKAGTNKLQLAFRSRIKLFYRPAGLKGDSSQAAESLKWEVSGGKLTAVNNSPYYVSLLGVRSQSGSAKGEGEMVAPFGRMPVTGSKASFNAGQAIEYQYINDWGAIRKVNTSI